MWNQKYKLTTKLAMFHQPCRIIFRLFISLRPICFCFALIYFHVLSTKSMQLYMRIIFTFLTQCGLVMSIYRQTNHQWTLWWRHNGQDGVSNHQHHHCWLSYLFGRRSKKTSKLRVTGLCVRGIHRGPVNSPHKWPVTRKMFPFDEVIMIFNLTNTHFRFI